MSGDKSSQLLGSSEGVEMIASDLMQVYDTLTTRPAADPSSSSQDQQQQKPSSSVPMHPHTHSQIPRGVERYSQVYPDHSVQHDLTYEQRISSPDRTAGSAHGDHDLNQADYGGNRKRESRSYSSRRHQDQSSDASYEESSRGSKRKKQKKDLNGRWSNRFTWPDDLHRDFVSAIFDVGLKHASPNVLLQHMPPHEQLNTERVKSHLQKYRLHRNKSKKEFMAAFDAGLKKRKAEAGGELASTIAFSAMQAEAFGGSASSAGAEVFNASSDGSDHPISPKSTSVEDKNPEAQKLSPAAVQGETILLPKLTDEEKASPIGVSYGFLMGLFFSLRQQLMQQREKDAERSENSAPAARSKLEESTLMRQEMQSQMEFQNKMRELKQMELNKFKPDAAGNEGVTTTNVPLHSSNSPIPGQHEVSAESRNRSLSLGRIEDIFSDEDIDSHLFQFLMSEES